MNAKLTMSNNALYPGYHFIIAVDDDGDVIAHSTPFEKGDIREAKACAKQMNDVLAQSGYGVDNSALPWVANADDAARARMYREGA